LIEVGDDIFHRFDARAQPHQAIADAHPFALFGRDFAMRRYGRVKQQAVNIA
jgi:hypothetical protein